jgi:hypothetical protein
VATFDLNILPIHRQNGQEFADLPGLLAVAPPRKAARGRDKDSLDAVPHAVGQRGFFHGGGQATAGNAANLFYQTAVH